MTADRLPQAMHWLVGDIPRSRASPARDWLTAKTQSGQTTTYTWDALDRLTTIAATGLNVTYAYDGDGRRIAKNTGSGAQFFTWDVQGLGFVLTDATAGKEYLWAGGLVAQLTTSTGAASYAHVDGLGSIKRLTDGSGAATYTAQYDAYGAKRSETGTALPFGFAGEWLDGESSLIYLRARYHDSATGRFLSQAPVPTEPRYGYGAGDPVNTVDPSGMCPPVSPHSV